MQTKNPTKIGFQKHQQGKVTVYFDPAFVPASAVENLLTLPETLQTMAGRDSRSAGHKSVWTWEPEWSGTTKFVVRKYMHGGLLRHVWRDWFLQRGPMFRELNIARHLQRNGVPTPSPVALRLQKLLGPVHRAHYISQKVLDSVDLLSLCRKFLESTAPPPEVRQSLASAIASLLFRLHEAGICHKDLNLKNILLSPETSPTRAFIIDFKKAVWKEEITLREGFENLVRLDRSIVKWAASRKFLTLSDRLRVLRNYIRLRGGQNRGWKDIARGILTHHRLHSLTRK
ncbi:MAG: lipopolysaccharide kinase InaA family protein [Candidatus Brocadiia bacterium]